MSLFVVPGLHQTGSPPGAHCQEQASMEGEDRAGKLQDRAGKPCSCSVLAPGRSRRVRSQPCLVGLMFLGTWDVHVPKGQDPSAYKGSVLYRTKAGELGEHEPEGSSLELIHATSQPQRAPVVAVSMSWGYSNKSSSACGSEQRKSRFSLFWRPVVQNQ